MLLQLAFCSSASPWALIQPHPSSAEALQCIQGNSQQNDHARCLWWMTTRPLFCDILHPPPPCCAEIQSCQTIVMPAYFLMILHFSSSLTEGIWKRAVRNFPLQKQKRKSLIYFLVQSGHFSTHCTLPQSPSSRVNVERLKSCFCCFICLVMAQVPAWAWQTRRRAHSKPALLQLPYQEGGQQGRRHPCLGQTDPPLATKTTGVTWTEPRLTSDFWALQMWQERD